MRKLLVLSVTFFLGLTAQAALFDEKLMINGAGATFPFPLYSKWFAEYQKTSPRIAFNYQSIGSGGGIRQLLDETVDFGASDAPMNDQQMKKGSRTVVHIPATMGAVVITFNLPGGVRDLKLTGAMIADIFLGKIKKWDDEQLLAVNPQLKAAFKSGTSSDILVVHRSDGSGTTAVFSDYLSKVSPEWKSKVGKGSALRWPTGIGGKGNEGVTSFVKQIPGSVGYVELVFAKTLKLPFASVAGFGGDGSKGGGGNASLSFIEPSIESVTAAAEGALKLKLIPDDFRSVITLVNAPKAYPISSFTYLLIYDHLKNEKEIDQANRTREIAKRKEMLSFLKWALTTGQEISPKLNYAPLPQPLVERVMKRVSELSADSVAEKNTVNKTEVKP